MWNERLRWQSISGGLGPSRGREAACTPEGRVNQAAGFVEKSARAAAKRATRTERDLPKRISPEACRASERVGGPGKAPGSTLVPGVGVEPTRAL